MAIRRNTRTPARKTSARKFAGDISLGPLPSIMGYMLRQAQVAVFGEFMAAMGKYRVRPTQFAILLVIYHNPGLRQTQVAEALALKRANLVPLMHELEKRKLAKRTQVATDRRSYALYLTPTGKALLARLNKAHLAHEQNIRELLGATGHLELLDLLRRLSTLRVRKPR